MRAIDKVLAHEAFKQPRARRGAAARRCRGGDHARASQEHLEKIRASHAGRSEHCRATSTATRSCRPAPGRRRCAPSAPVSQAVDAVMGGRCRNAFCQVRPPGHHAEAGPRHGLLPVLQRGHRRPPCPRQARRGARRRRRFRRPPRQRHAGYLLVGQGPVLRLDAPDAAVPRHRSVWTRPASATSGMRRCGPATPASVPRCGHESRILPALHNFGPDLVVVSAGFDAHQARSARQPAARRGGFHVGDGEARGRGEAACGGRIVSMLEGGYDLEGAGALGRACTSRR